MSILDRAKILELLKNEPYKIGHFVGFKDLTTLHNEWLKSFLFEKKDQTLLAHRGSYKTTCLSVFLALHTVIFPNENIMFFRKTDTDVTEVIKQTQKILHTGCMGEICRTLYKGHGLNILKETDSEINTDLCTNIKGASQIVGLGIKTSMTGKHADIVVTDDIVNVKDRISRAEREQTKLQYMELQNVKNRSGRFINTGTPWHKEDAFSLMPNITRHDCYSTGLMSREEIERLRHSMSDSLFAANYELKHIADVDVMFSDPHFTDNKESIYNGLAHIDAAYGGGDYTAFTIMRKTPKGYTAFGKIWHKHVDECISEIKELHALYKAGSISCERNADKGYLEKELKELGMHTRSYQEHMNKYIKISTYLRAAWDSITWLTDSDPDYINQMLDYSEVTEHDDAPDSAASLIRQIESKPRLNTSIHGGI